MSCKMENIVKRYLALNHTPKEAAERADFFRTPNRLFATAHAIVFETSGGHREIIGVFSDAEDAGQYLYSARFDPLLFWVEPLEFRKPVYNELFYHRHDVTVSSTRPVWFVSYQPQGTERKWNVAAFAAVYDAENFVLKLGNKSGEYSVTEVEIPVSIYHEVFGEG